MLGAAGIVDRIAHAKIVEPIGPAGMLAARNQERIDHTLARYQGFTRTLQLGVEKAEVERGIMDHERRVTEKSNQIVGHFGEESLILEELLAQAVNGERFGRHAALGIEVGVEGLPGRYAID